MAVNQTCLYRTAPGIVWLQDADHALLVELSSGRFWKLDATETAVWGWFQGGCSYERACAMLSLLDNLPAAATEYRMRRILDSWQDRGIVLVDGAADDQPGYQHRL